MFDKLGKLLKSYLENDGKIEETPEKTPSALHRDFIRLGVMPGTTFDDCKKAYKKLLKKHHPDKNAENSLSQTLSHRTASEITESFQKIKRWYTVRKLD